MRKTCASLRCAQAAIVFVCMSFGASAADQALIDAARKEGQAVWYTALIVNQFVRPAAEFFEKKYGVKVNYVRADPDDIVLRVMSEARAGRLEADVIDGTTTAPPLKREGLLLKWLPDTAANMPKEVVDAEGYWAALYVAVSTPTINTNLVSPADKPRTWEDLLKPRWTGRMAWSAQTNLGAPGFVALVTREYGDEKGRQFLAQLAGQRITNLPSTTRQVLDQVMAGEYEMNIMTSVHQSLGSAAQGAPVKWLPFSHAAVSLVTASVLRNAPHPNAAKLLVDFLISDEGQAMFRDNGYIPASPRVPAKDPRAMPDGKLFRGQFFTPEELDAKIAGWTRLYKDMFQ